MMHNALSGLKSPSKTRHLFPVAWPVVEAEHTLVIRITEDIGIVERYVLDCITRFGPVIRKDVSTMTGLDTDILDTVLKRLERIPSLITESEMGMKFTSSIHDQLNDNDWSYDKTVPFSFPVCGVTGKLLKPEHGQIHKRYRVTLNISNQEAGVADQSGKHLSGMLWAASTHSPGERHLADLIQQQDTGRKADMGIPEGTVSLVEGTGKILREYHAAVIARHMHDGSLVLHSAENPDQPIIEVSHNKLEDFAEALRINNRDANTFLKKRHSMNVSNTWSDHADIKEDDTALIITLKNAPAFEKEALNPQAEGREDSSGRIPPSMTTALHRPYYWNPYSYRVTTIKPGDLDTARVMMHLQAIEAIGKLVRNADHDINLHAWWKDLTNKICRTWELDVNTLNPDLNTFCDLALQSSDSEILEFFAAEA